MSDLGLGGKTRSREWCAPDIGRSATATDQKAETVCHSRVSVKVLLYRKRRAFPPSTDLDAL